MSIKSNTGSAIVPKNTILVHRVCAAHGGRTLFGPVSFSVPPGGIVAVRGANGAGKTTLLHILAGLTPPARGHARICIGDRLADPGDIHLIGHGDTVKNDMDVVAQARYWAALLRSPAHRVADALDAMGLGAYADMPGHALSAGLRRRLALTRLLLADRPVWLLDEPFVSLDDDGTNHIAALIARQARRGGIVIAAMHQRSLSSAETIWIGRPDSTQPTRAHTSVEAGNPSHSLCGSAQPDAQPYAQPESVWRAVRATFEREFHSSLIERLAPPLGMYLGCASLVPLAAGHRALESFAPPMTVIALALAALLPAERMFRSDLEDGTLQTICACCTCSLDMLAVARLAGAWAGVGLPLAIVSPLPWVMLGGGFASVGMCVIVAALAGGGFTLFAGLAASLAVALPRAGVVMIVVALPLFWPMMIFASATLRAHNAGEPFLASLSLTASALLFALALVPLAVAQALRAAAR